MRTRHRAVFLPRRGNVIPLTAFLMVCIVAMVAFAVDIGYVAVIKSELQSTADAAALAGVSKLYNRTATKVSTLQTSTERSAARQEAQLYGQKNGNYMRNMIGPTTTQTFTIRDQDVEFGVLINGQFHAAASYPIIVNGTTYHYADSIRVTVRRDATSNGRVGLFFAPVIGTRDAGITATAVASMRVANSVRPPSGPNEKSGLLPFALDIRMWQLMNQPTNPTLQDVRNLFPEFATDAQKLNEILNSVRDDFSYDPYRAPSGENYSQRVRTGTDGARECKLFPIRDIGGSGSSGVTPGNFATIDLGRFSNTTSGLGEQIANGPTASQLQAVMNGQSPPQTGSLRPPFTTGGDTGISAAMKDEVGTIKGQPRVLPLYDMVSNTGNGTVYRIVGFASVSVMDSNFHGNNKGIKIQRVFGTDTTAEPDPNPASENFLFTSPTLTQ